jgi:pilus assembly protein CpaE
MELSILLKGLPADVEAGLGATLEELGLRRVNDPAQRPSLAVVSLDRDVAIGVQVVQALTSAGARVAVAAQSKDPELILVAMRAGAREFVSSSDRSALESAIRSLARPTLAASLGTVTAVFSAKGGMGATSIATHLAGLVASRDERVCLLDLDLELGDALAVLDLAGGYSIADVVKNMRRLDRDLLDSSIPRHRSGVAVLARGEAIDDGSRVEPESVPKLLSFLRQHYANVLIDGLRGFGDLSLAALDASDRILLVVTQEVAAVRNAQRCLEIFRRLGYPDDKVKLVINRFLKGSRITQDVVAETTGVPVAATVANDFSLLNRAANHGNLLPEEAPRSALARDIAALRPLLGGVVEAGPRRASLIGRWFAQRRAVADGAQ